MPLPLHSGRETTAGKPRGGRATYCQFFSPMRLCLSTPQCSCGLALSLSAVVSLTLSWVYCNRSIDLKAGAVARVTLKDIAEEAGVSMMTVSNVLNDRSDKASGETAVRIKQIASRLGYVRSVAARSLAAKSSRVIVGYLEPLLRRRGYHLVIRGIPDPAAVPDAFQEWNLDGAIYVGFPADHLAAMSPGIDRPLVHVEGDPDVSEYMNVRVDDHGGAVQAVRHLLERGHREIAFAGPLNLPRNAFRSRFEGYSAALADVGIPVDPRRVINIEFNWNEAVELGRDLPNRVPSVTAVFASADLIAIGIVRGLADVGKRVPDDISLVGFDDVDLASLAIPRLTTVAQSISDKAVAAVRLLLSQLEGNPPDEREIKLEVSLRERDSVRSLTPDGHA